jgi:hypothetical protein
MVAVAAAALAALLLSGSLDPADAKKGWSGGRSFHGSFHSSGKFYGFRAGRFHSGKIFHGYKFGGIHHRHRFHGRRHFFVGVPLVYGAYYGYGGGCYWLRKRALYTGSPYWWNRYYDCLNGYY